MMILATLSGIQDYLFEVRETAGNPMPPSTHEADAWADADCRRIFLHFDSDAAILDRLAGPLH